MTRQSYRYVVATILFLMNNTSFFTDADKEAPQCLANESNNNSTCQAPPSPFQCSLYLAPSTIPGAGLGIFTGIERHEGDTVGEGDVILPIADVWWHLQASEDYHGFHDAPENLDPTTDYVWHGPEMGMHSESSDAQRYVTAFAPGLDAAINCNLALINVDKDEPQYDTGGLHRSRDPGAGAFTPYHNSTNEVTAHIPVGGELFKYYGDSWFITREEWFGIVPFREDYPRAEELIKTFEQKVGPQQFTSELRSDVYDFMTGVKLAAASRTIQALPKTVSHFQTVAEEGIHAYYQKFASRTTEELEQTGRCIDTMSPGPSTITQAGRGAFAKRSFVAGDVVTGTPVLYTHRPDFMRIYDGDWFHLSTSTPDKSKLKTHSIVMNYCWNHVSSSLFLCPYGYGVNYINHNQTLANVKMQWTPAGIMGQRSEYLHQSPEAMDHLSSPGLVMDIVATREIQPGEELFLNYGDAWEQAWNDHVRDFEKRHAHFANYTSAREWNALQENRILRTDKEQVHDPYPDNLELRCLIEIGDKNLTVAEAKELWTMENAGTPCSVIGKRIDDTGNVLYQVWYKYPENDDDEDDDDDDHSWYASDWIVRETMQMADKPYTTDIWLETAFRHPIGIPDDVFPVAWRGFGMTTEDER